ncbi:helix-hairpin-helix domain-containing protein, partial [Balneolaceae bacterium ANBcel3]|nr:helix-hairpin-helix domain-containing protein [Balneolaceae bacterium ANBcel3]
AIGFLANQVHLRNLGTRVAEMIEQVQERVNNAIDWLIDRALQAGSSIMEMGRSAVSTVSDWLGLRKEFRLADNKKHEIYFRSEDPEAPVIIASDPKTLEQILQSKKWNGNDIPEDSLSKLQRLANEIDQNRDSQGVGKGEKIKECFEKIAEILTNIGGPPLPATYVKTNDTLGSGTAEIGKEVDIMPLSLNPGSLAGSQPTIESDMGRDLKDMYPNYFVEGHLLNHKLHGPGNRRWNMTPITQKTNQDMEKEVESGSKEQLLSTGKVLQYHVTVNYPSDTLDITKPTYPHEQIATSLTMIVRQLEYDSSKNEWVKDDSVNETNKTITHNTSTVPGFGTGSLNHDVDLEEADKTALQRIPGIGSERADAIVNYRITQKDNGNENPFSDKSNLRNVTGIGDRLTEIIKRNPNVKPHP